MVASSLEIGEMILVTNVYAPIDLPGKIKLWSHIRYVKSYHPLLPLIVARDLNFVISLEEKWGRMARLGSLFFRIVALFLFLLKLLIGEALATSLSRSWPVMFLPLRSLPLSSS